MNFRQKLERMAEIYSGIAIFSVDKGSTTHRAGVRAGDILIVVNGRRVRRLADYAGARKLRDDGLALVVVRDGREIKLYTSNGAPQPRSTDALQPTQASGKAPKARESRLPPALEHDSLTCPWRGAA